MLDRLQQDVLRHVGHALDDYAAMLLLRREPAFTQFSPAGGAADSGAARLVSLSPAPPSPAPPSPAPPQPSTAQSGTAQSGTPQPSTASSGAAVTRGLLEPSGVPDLSAAESSLGYLVGPVR